MPSTLIVFADAREAAATVERLQAKGRGAMRWFPEGAVLVTGMGSIAAAARLLEVGHCFDQIWNIGFAGALCDRSGIHAIGSVEKFASFPETTSGPSRELFHSIHPRLTIGAGCHLITSDFPIFDDSLKTQLQGDFVDMEGWGIAHAAQLLGKPLRMWKIASDSAGTAGGEQLRTQVPVLATQIADFLEKTLHA